jgi:hypothetical protein
MLSSIMPATLTYPLERKRPARTLYRLYKFENTKIEEIEKDRIYRHAFAELGNKMPELMHEHEYYYRD